LSQAINKQIFFQYVAGVISKFKIDYPMTNDIVVDMNWAVA